MLRGPGISNLTTGLRIEADDVMVCGLRIDGCAPAIIVAAGDRARVVGDELAFVIPPPDGGNGGWAGVQVQEGTGHEIRTAAIADTNWIHGFATGVDLVGGTSAVVGNVIQENQFARVLLDLHADARDSVSL